MSDRPEVALSEVAEYMERTVEMGGELDLRVVDVEELDDTEWVISRDGPIITIDTRGRT